MVMFSKGVEIENIVICLLLRRLDKDYSRRFKATCKLKNVNTKNIFGSLTIFPCMKSFCFYTSDLRFRLHVDSTPHKLISFFSTCRHISPSETAHLPPESILNI